MAEVFARNRFKTARIAGVFRRGASVRDQSFRNSSGRRAMLTAIRRASSAVGGFARPAHSRDLAAVSVEIGCVRMTVALFFPSIRSANQSKAVSMDAVANRGEGTLSSYKKALTIR